MGDVTFVNDAKVMSKGQVTIPKNVREALGVRTGDRITFVVEGNRVKIINSTIYALEKFQKEMAGKASSAEFINEEDIAGWITNSRRREAAE